MSDIVCRTDPLLRLLPGRQTSRAVARLERQTLMRLARVQADGMVRAEKL